MRMPRFGSKELNPQERIAIVIFPILSALAFVLLIGGIIATGGADRLTFQCPPGFTGPNAVAYTRFAPLDTGLCFYVSFFEASLTRASLPLTTDFLACMGAMALLLPLEAARIGRPRVAALPTAVGLLYQLVGAGLVLPLFWLAFLLAGGHRLSGRAARVDRISAKAVLGAWLGGFALPTVLMYAPGGPRLTALWQPFPLWMAILQQGYLLARQRVASSRRAGSLRGGHAVVQLTLGLAFAICVVGHVGVLWHLRFDLAAVKQQFLPQISPAVPIAETLAECVMQFLQWDGTFFFGSAMLASLWFAGSGKELAAIFAWHVAATVVVGPGAAVMGVFMWREARLKGQRDKF